MIPIVVGLAATAAGIAAGWAARSYTLHRRITILRDIVRHQEHRIEADTTAWLARQRTGKRRVQGDRRARRPRRRDVAAGLP